MLEEQLHHAQKMQSIGTLAGGIAHDFNNLLTTILGCGQLLLMKTEFYGKTRTYLERIMEAAESAAQLTHDLLAFSRKQVAKPVVVDPSMIVDKIEKMAIRIIGENITLKVMHGGSDLRIMADINQMEQVLMNIIINARDAMPEGGVLTIRTEQVQLNEDFTKCHGGGKPGDYVRIAIIDNGIGMDSDTMERIFEPFFTTKDVGKGTGLGLSIVYGIIRKHNGYVTVSSEPEKGTTVEVYLPLADIADKIQATVPNAMHFERGKGTILIAEDDQLMLNMLKTILEEGGYKVIESVDGEDALQKYVQNKEKIDMVILDVLMPKKNAKAVYDVIKVMDPFQKVLFVSGYTPEDIEKSGIFREDFNLIRKPFLPDLLLRKVREVSAR
jgi:CheY-like chemotaxis protein